MRRLPYKLGVLIAAVTLLGAPALATPAPAYAEECSVCEFSDEEAEVIDVRR
jgi:hypothetical protein